MVSLVMVFSETVLGLSPRAEAIRHFYKFKVLLLLTHISFNLLIPQVILVK